MAQQRKNSEGKVVDDIDARVEELQKKANTRICPNCKTEMAKTKRKCVNPTCRVDLKAAEQELSGEDILGTALVTPPRCYNYRFKENEVVIALDEEESSVSDKVSTINQDYVIEWEDVPSSHPDHPVNVSVSDPVFVNPAGYKAVAEVLRRVGHTAHITRYGFSGPDSREWITVTMDGSPYVISEKLIASTFICLDCTGSGTEHEVVSYFDKEWNKHVEHVHKGESVNCAKEFDWVVLRIGPLHVEMNMVKTFFALNWDVFICSLAKELGFSSESAQKYAKSASNHHHAMAMIETMQVGGWCELLIPYIREQMEAQQPISVNDYLYRWVQQVTSPNYLYKFEMLWRYVGAIKLYHIGIRRNNAELVNCGLQTFAPMFSWHPFTSKYQLIELRDR